MKLRYHLDRKHDGLVVVEAEPQVRNIFVYSQTKNIIRVPLPYIIFAVRYTKNGHKVVYPGIYGSGLHVFCRTEPITKADDRVCFLPTDSRSLGLVCTEHSSDNKSFKSLKELVNYVVTHWWGHLHMVEYQPFGATAWQEAKFENLHKAQWTDAGYFHKALHIQKSYGQPNERKIPSDADFTDLPWPADLEWTAGEPPPCARKSSYDEW